MLQKLEFNVDQDKHVLSGALTIEYKDGYVMMLTVPDHEMWKMLNGKEPVCCFYAKEVEPGIYETGLNFEHRIANLTDFEVVNSYERLGKDGLPRTFDHASAKPGSFMEYFENTVEPYGVADNVDQIKAYYKDQISCDNPIVISIYEVNKANQPDRGGWRWHKWGKYIGTREPQCEYLYDEPEIDSVYVFQVYAVKRKTP